MVSGEYPTLERKDLGIEGLAVDAIVAEALVGGEFGGLLDQLLAAGQEVVLLDVQPEGDVLGPVVLLPAGLLLLPDVPGPDCHLALDLGQAVLPPFHQLKYC